MAGVSNAPVEQLGDAVRLWMEVNGVVVTFTTPKRYKAKRKDGVSFDSGGWEIPPDNDILDAAVHWWVRGRKMTQKGVAKVIAAGLFRDGMRFTIAHVDAVLSEVKLEEYERKVPIRRPRGRPPAELAAVWDALVPSDEPDEPALEP